MEKQEEGEMFTQLHGGGGIIFGKGCEPFG